MIKHIKTTLFGLLVFLTAATFSACKNNNATPKDSESSVQPEDTAGYPRFIVISDTHFGNAHQGKGPMVKAPQALKHLTGKTPKADALFVVGDITDNGKAAEYDDQLLPVFGDTANVPEGLPVYFMMGNHDHFSGSNATNTYLSKVGQPLHQYILIKGYPFITISESGSDENDFNTAAVSFLSDNLAKAAKDCPGKPVFVFIHVPICNTTYGSVQSGALPDGGWCTDKFLRVLEQYPQAVVFSGHTHYPIGDPRSIWQGGFTAINTGSATYAEVEGNIGLTGGTLPADYGNVTEGLIVSVEENGDVKLERWDTYRNEEIKPHWLLRAPHDGTQFAYKGRTGGAAPAFKATDSPAINISSSTCSVTFPQASDDEVVHHYKVEILDGGKVVKKHLIFSGFYLNSEMPAQLTVSFTGLTENTSYTASVTAYDSYRQASPPISINFRYAK
jgi:3',5'-cyclic AMP phosphodiesterase CpdA